MADPAPAPARPVRRRSARGDGAQLREQLLEATVALLDAEGDASRVSVRAIARAAGVSPTALYLHFPDRDALVDAAVDRGFEAFNTLLLAAARSEPAHRPRLRAMGLAYLEFTERQPALYAVLFSTRRALGRSPTGPAIDPPRVQRDEALEALVAAVAGAAPDAGPDETWERAIALWAALHGYATLRANRPMARWPIAEDYVDRLLITVTGRPPPPPEGA